MAFFGGTDGKWQSDNVTAALQAKGLVAGDKVAHIQDFNFALGGPVKKDTLWFFASWRRSAPVTSRSWISRGATR